MYLPTAPLYPFGHGLSYTTFDYTNLRLDRTTAGTNDTVQVSFEVRNAGPRDGDEVVQLYVRDVAASVPVPQKVLRGFARLHIPRGQTRTVTLPVKVSSLGLWDDQTRAFQIEPGDFEIQIGASSADIRLCGTFHVE
jgi:beta-glucosidase